MSRYRGLDGLRGLAALSVVLSHILMTDAVFNRTYSGMRVSGWHAVLAYSPLHVAWAGTEAVEIFFVLSGFVLVLPFLDDPVTRRWIGYFPQRLSRLLIPIWAAVAWAVALAAVIPRGSGASSPWTAQHAHALTTSNVRQAIEVVRGANGLNTALWSMQWEVLFSLLLPAFVVGAILSRRLWWAGLCAAVLISGYGVHVGSASLEFFAMFAVGSCLAAGHPSWRSWFAERSRAQIWLIGAGALLLVDARWTAAPIATSTAALPWCTGLTLAGAAILVCLFTGTPAVAALGQSRWVAHLGRISFSLYLVHEPIVVSVAQLDHGHVSWLVVLAVALPLSLAVAALFHRWVEAPAHRFSRRIGARLMPRA